MNDNLFIDEGETNPYYNLKHFIIKSSFVISDMKTEEPISIVQFAEFVHEYIHYLQTFTTIHGLSALLSYMDKITKMTIDIGINVVTEKTSALEIIKKFRADYAIIRNRLYWKKEPRYMPNSNGNIWYFTKNIFNPIFKTQTEEVFIHNILDDKYYHVSSLMLRENMSMMAYCKVRNIGEDAVMDYIQIHPTPEKPYCSNYWLIFSYFLYRYPQITDKVKFTFFFCELALMNINTGTFVKKLLEDIDIMINKKSYSYSNANEFYKELFDKNIEAIKKDTIIIEKLIEVILNSLSKLKETQNFYLSVERIMILAKKGIEYKKSSSLTIYREVIDKRWLDEMSTMFSSPIIIQPNKTISTLRDDQNDVDLLGLIFGLSVITELTAYNDERLFCPFFESVPICTLKNDKTNAICLEEPLKIEPFNKGGCIFYNSCLILGLLPREELEKYL